MLGSKQRAQEAAEKLERNYREVTGSGRLTTATVEWDEGGAEPFGEAAGRAARKLRLLKARHEPEGSLPAGGAIAFCDSCRQQPRVDYDREAGDRLLCRTCLAKRDASGDVRRSVRRQGFWGAFVEGMTPQVRAEWERQEVLNAEARDFGAIGGRARPPGYLGVCYADGDRMGDLLEKAHEPGVYRALSEAMDLAVSAALGHALREIYARTGKGWQTPESYPGEDGPGHPFEVIAAGGDDVIVVSTAERALPLALAYCGAFKTQMTDRIADDEQLSNWWSAHGGDKQISASAGVLIAHDTMPAITLADRSRELLRSAKQGRDWLGADEGAIDFHVVTTAALGSIRAVRRAEYQVGDHTGLTARPYSLSGMDRLMEYARQVRKNIPSSKRADLYQALFQEPFPAVLDLLRLQSRLTPEAWKALRGAADSLKWASYYPYGEAPPATGLWRFTGLIDLLEVADLAPPAPEEER